MTGNGVVYTRYGLCSGYLKSRLNTDTVRVIAKEPSKFRFPLTIKPERTINDSSVILIGPGTGIAPFMAFLERFRGIFNDLDATSKAKRYLIYGSSNLDKEYIFR
jgi:sulfite reductase alpha subunit-like flavoprotein